MHAILRASFGTLNHCLSGPNLRGSWGVGNLLIFLSPHFLCFSPDQKGEKSFNKVLSSLAAGMVAGSLAASQEFLPTCPGLLTPPRPSLSSSMSSFSSSYYSFSIFLIFLLNFKTCAAATPPLPRPLLLTFLSSKAPFSFSSNSLGQVDQLAPPPPGGRRRRLDI